MSSADVVRSEIQRLRYARPFRPFALNMGDGDQVVIKDPDTLSFESPSGQTARSDEFYVMSKKFWLYSTFKSVASVVLVE